MKRRHLDEDIRKKTIPYNLCKMSVFSNYENIPEEHYKKATKTMGRYEQWYAIMRNST
jgi:hypothetical protein